MLKCAFIDSIIPSHLHPLLLIFPIYNRALGHLSIKSAISNLGQSGFKLGDGLSRSHAHFSLSSGARSFSNIWITYLPSTGKNL